MSQSEAQVHKGLPVSSNEDRDACTFFQLPAPLDSDLLDEVVPAYAADHKAALKVGIHTSCWPLCF